MSEALEAAGGLSAAELPAALEVQGLAVRPVLSAGGQPAAAVVLLDLTVQSGGAGDA